MTDRDHLTVVTAETIKPGDTLAYQHHTYVYASSQIGETPVRRATVDHLTATQAVMTNGERWGLAHLPRVIIEGRYADAEGSAVFDGPHADTRARAATRANQHLTALYRHLGGPRPRIITDPGKLLDLVDTYGYAARIAWGDHGSWEASIVWGEEAGQ